jgi:hypothetical protein
VQTQEACNNDDNYHYADDVENVHWVSDQGMRDFNMKAQRWNRNVWAGRYVPSFTEAVCLGIAPTSINRRAQTSVGAVAAKGGQFYTDSVTDSCRDGALITQHDVSHRDSLANAAHFQRFGAAAIRATSRTLNLDLLNGGTPIRAGCWLLTPADGSKGSLFRDRSTRRCLKANQNLLAQ